VPPSLVLNDSAPPLRKNLCHGNLEAGGDRFQHVENHVLVTNLDSVQCGCGIEYFRREQRNVPPLQSKLHHGHRSASEYLKSVELPLLFYLGAR